MKATKTDPNAELQENAEQHKSLTNVLVKSEHVETLVNESAEELSTVLRVRRKHTFVENTRKRITDTG